LAFSPGYAHFGIGQFTFTQNKNTLARPRSKIAKAQTSGPHQYLQAGGDTQAAVATPQGISATRSDLTRHQQ